MQTRVWVLVVVSCCAAAVAFAAVPVSFAFAQEWFVAYPHCVLPYGDLSPVPPLRDELYSAWQQCGIAGLLSWSCAFVARRIASAAPREVRRTTNVVLVLSILAVVGFVVAFGYYQLTCYALRMS